MSFETLKKGSKGQSVRLVQKALNEMNSAKLKVDASYGPSLETAVRNFQVSNSLPATGTVDENTYSLMEAHIKDRFVSYEQIDELAIDIGIKPSALRAVFDVESKGDGFNTDGSLVLLFEGHWFYKLIAQTQGVRQAEITAQKFPDICYKVWTRKHYLGGIAEHRRFNKAVSLNEELALKSASYGLFQVMGFNHKLAGYDDVFEYYDESNASELFQLEAGVSFIVNEKRVPPSASGLARVAPLQALKTGNWASFAYIYNGAGYKENQYHLKLAAAQRAHSSAD